jgi:hypothetical protein
LRSSLCGCRVVDSKEGCHRHSSALKVPLLHQLVLQHRIGPFRLQISFLASAVVFPGCYAVSCRGGIVAKEMFSENEQRKKAEVLQRRLSALEQTQEDQQICSTDTVQLLSLSLVRTTPFPA